MVDDDCVVGGGVLLSIARPEGEGAQEGGKGGDLELCSRIATYTESCCGPQSCAG